MTTATCHSCHRMDRPPEMWITLADGRQVALCQVCVADSRTPRGEPIKRQALAAGQPVTCPHGHGVDHIEGEGTGVIDGQTVAYACCRQCDQLIAATWRVEHAGQERLV